MVANSKQQTSYLFCIVFSGFFLFLSPISSSHHQKAFRNKSHTSHGQIIIIIIEGLSLLQSIPPTTADNHGQRPGLKRNKSNITNITILNHQAQYVVSTITNIR